MYVCVCVYCLYILFFTKIHMVVAEFDDKRREIIIDINREKNCNRTWHHNPPIKNTASSMLTQRDSLVITFRKLKHTVKKILVFILYILRN